MKYLLYVNGLDGSGKQRLGCDCARCLDPKTTANPSISLLAYDGDTLVQHILFDIGAGQVKQSLIQNPHLKGHKARLDLIALTHWHPDHAGGLRWLVRGWEQTNRLLHGTRPPLPPTYCRTASAEWIKKENAGDWVTFFNPILSGEESKPGTILPPLATDLPEVTITPVTVSHFNADMHPDDTSQKYYASTAYVIETPSKKAVFMWDVDTTNEWLWQDCADDVFALIHDADYLFIDCTTWDTIGLYKRHFAHLCFTKIVDVANYLTPKQTFLTHLGGHFDKPGNKGYGFTDAQWQYEASSVWHEQHVAGSVHVPFISQELEM